jgi:pilus assembly protein CpaB
MGPVRVIILCVALLAAVGAALVARTIAKGQDKTPPVAAAPTVAAPPAPPMAQVLVAKTDLAPGKRILSSDLAWQAWPEEAVGPTYVVKTKAEASGPAKVAGEATAAVRMATGAPDDVMLRYIGMTVREPFVAGEPITDRKVVRAGDAGLMAVGLTPGKRAMAVPLSPESAAGGFILPGDHVDVIQVRKIDGPGGQRVVSGTVLKNVRVLAIDQNTGAQKGAAVVGATATLEVPLDQAEALVLAKAQGELNLVLRSYADTAGPSIKLGQLAEDVGLGRSAVVKVYRMGKPTEVPVSR